MIDFRSYFLYRFLNSLFAGLSIGSVFVIYMPLEPYIYSIGGLFLAVASLYIAKFYVKLIKYPYFRGINMGAEVLMVFVIVYFLISPSGYVSALLFYAGYQVVFAFGSYIYRAETLLLGRKLLLRSADVAKQKGYIVGLIFSFVYFKGIEYIVSDKIWQVYYLHIFLLVLQVVIILSLYYALYPKLSNKNSFRVKL